MEKYRVKRVPVMRGTTLVGIVSRANLLHALASLSREVVPGPKTDETIRDAVLAELDRQSWAPRHMIDVVVRNGVVELWGTVIDPDQRDAARVAAETVPGVKAVKCHIVWVEPMSGMAFSDPEEDEAEVDADRRPRRRRRLQFVQRPAEFERRRSRFLTCLKCDASGRRDEFARDSRVATRGTAKIEHDFNRADGDRT